MKMRANEKYKITRRKNSFEKHMYPIKMKIFSVTQANVFSILLTTCFSSDRPLLGKNVRNM
jgi:hypothetical protein